MKKILFTAFGVLSIALNLSAQWKIIDNWGTAPVNRIEKSNDGMLYAASDIGFFSQR
ncbi:MAG: hypothetical protein IPH31_10680 [Lewinellaceae bacterium]|nr:hypothetical protein [Lewinellaceae bacterium]